MLNSQSFIQAAGAVAFFVEEDFGEAKTFESLDDVALAGFEQAELFGKKFDGGGKDCCGEGLRRVLLGRGLRGACLGGEFAATHSILNKA